MSASEWRPLRAYLIALRRPGALALQRVWQAVNIPCIANCWTKRKIPTVGKNSESFR